MLRQRVNFVYPSSSTEGSISTAVNDMLFDRLFRVATVASNGIFKFPVHQKFVISFFFSVRIRFNCIQSLCLFFYCDVSRINHRWDFTYSTLLCAQTLRLLRAFFNLNRCIPNRWLFIGRLSDYFYPLTTCYHSSAI